MKETRGLSSATESIINNFVNKICSAVGCVYNDSEYKAKKDAYKILYHKIAENNDYNEYTKSFLISNLKKELKHYENQRSIIQEAILNLDDNINVENIDNDWLLYFFDEAKKISNDEMKNIWGKVLADEFNSPQSIHKSLLHTLSCIDLQSAKVFNNLCQFSVSTDNNTELLTFLDFNTFKKELLAYNITFDTLHDLERYGLIYSNTQVGYSIEEKTNINILTSKRIIEIKPNMNGKIPLGNVFLSYDGQTLCKCITRNENSLLLNMIHTICDNLIIKDTPIHNSDI